MVEIKHVSDPHGEKEPRLDRSIHEEEKYRLLFTKSKVYVHPTAYARDNMPGFVALVKRVSIGTPSEQRC